MPPEVKLLSAEQYLLTTLVIKLAVVATLATMLVRFRQFRRILLTEQRAWRERLVLAFSFGIPLSVGVAARLLLNYDAADLSLAGPFLTGLLAGPYAGAIVGVLVGALNAGEDWEAALFEEVCQLAREWASELFDLLDQALYEREGRAFRIEGYRSRVILTRIEPHPGPPTLGSRWGKT